MKEEFKKEQEELQVIAAEKKNDDIWSGKSYFLICHLLIFSPHYWFSVKLLHKYSRVQNSCKFRFMK